MPKELREKLQWMYLLLPGFLSLVLIGFVYGIDSLTEFQTLYYGFVLSLLNTALAAALLWSLRALTAVLLWGLRFVRGERAPFAMERTLSDFVSADENVAGLFFTTVIAVSIFSGVLIGLAAERDLLYRSLRAFPATATLHKRSPDRPLVFLFKQNTGGQLKTDGDGRPEHLKVTDAWVRVHLEDRTYAGWPEFFPSDDDNEEIWLSPACYVSSQGSSKQVAMIEGPGVLIYERDIKSIEFIDAETSECAKKVLDASPGQKTSPHAPTAATP